MANLIKPTGINTIWATNGTKTDPGDAKTNTGWVVETPPYQADNWVQWKQDSFNAHVNQHGVAVWDAVTEYQGNLSYAKGSDGIVYKCLQTNTNTDPANTLNAAYWTQAFETYGSVAIVTNALNAHLANYTTLAGIGNIATARSNLQVYSKTEGDTRYAALLGSSVNNFSVAVATLPTHAVPLSQFSSLLTQATETTVGVLKLSTNALAAAGVDDLTAMTPLKTANSFLSKAGNLAGLSNVPTARTNLGLGTMAIETSTSFLRGSNNLSDVSSIASARANLGITSTATQIESYFLRAGQNLADIGNAATARTNLGLTSTATTAITLLMQKSDNLSGLTNAATARSNLGLSDSAILASSTWLIRGNNLSDLTNVQSARNSLGLGAAATKNCPGVTGDLDFTSALAEIGWEQSPSGKLEQWGVVNLLGGSNNLRVTFPKPFPAACFNIQLTNYENYANEGNTIRVMSKDTTGFTLSNGVGNTVTEYFWRAIGN